MPYLQEPEPDWTPKPNRVLVLRSCEWDRDDQLATGYKGFEWPTEPGAEVVAPDWDPIARCGHGLHGLLWGVGNPSLMVRGRAIWMVVEVHEADIVWVNDNKVKFPVGRIVYAGDFAVCARIISKHAPDPAGRAAELRKLSMWDHQLYVKDLDFARKPCETCGPDTYEGCTHVEKSACIEVPAGPIANLFSSEVKPGQSGVGISGFDYAVTFVPVGHNEPAPKADALPLHTVALDIDLPCKVVPSSTGGHFHLFIDKQLTWDQYRQLIEVMAAVGLVEPGYAKASIARKATLVRLPWVRKPPLAQAPEPARWVSIGTGTVSPI